MSDRPTAPASGTSRATAAVVPDPWSDALLAARLVARDPGLSGAVVRGPAGPVRDAWLAAYRAAAVGPVVRVPLGIDDERLLGGVDLAATLAAGQRRTTTGLIAAAAGGTLVLAMAERIDSGLAGRLAAAADAGTVRLVLLDEGEGDEHVPPALAERAGVWLALPDRVGTDVRPGVFGDRERGEGAAAPGRRAVTHADVSLRSGRPQSDSVDASDTIDTLCAAAFAFGVGSARAGLFAVRAARGCTALAGRPTIDDADVAAAARLVLAPRATRLPAASDHAGEAPPAEAADEAVPPTGGANGGPAAEPDKPASAMPPETTPADPTDRSPDAAVDRVVAAILPALPPGLFAALAAGRAPPGRGGGGGALRSLGRRGRPLPSRAGQPRGGQRLALVDTLRAAAPWQPLRRAAAGTYNADRCVIVRRDDFRVQRFAERAAATTIFAVDASGSAAAARLAEAKGAVELLLADAYVARTEVALVAFRGTAAAVVLPPTRSLARAKRQLADLAGGGGTPLAAGLDVAAALALAERRRGRSPFVVVLTDGRANIARDRTASRRCAAADALAAARAFAADRVAAVFIDTAVRPRPEGAALAAAMAARYAPLPAASAAALVGMVRATAPA